MQRSDEAAGREGGVEAPGLLERLRVDDRDRVQSRPLFIVGVDAGQVASDEALAGEVTRLEGGVHLRNGCLFDREGLRPQREASRRERQGETREQT